jgi:hypothetical protein
MSIGIHQAEGLLVSMEPEQQRAKDKYFQTPTLEIIPCATATSTTTSLNLSIPQSAISRVTSPPSSSMPLNSPTSPNLQSHGATEIVSVRKVPIIQAHDIDVLCKDAHAAMVLSIAWASSARPLRIAHTARRKALAGTATRS